MKQQQRGRTKRRRPRGSGSVYRKGAYWWISYRTLDGRRVAESSESTRKGDAETLLRSKVGDIDRGKNVTPQTGKLTFHEAAKALIGDYTNRERRSVDEAERRIKLHLEPYFRNSRLASIDTVAIRSFIEHRRQQGIRRERDGETVRVSDVSSAEINRELTLLKRMFSLAIQDGRILHKPHVPMLAERNTRVGFFEPEQIASVLAHLPAGIQPAIEFAYVTGWRVNSEVLPLEWRQVDFAASEIRLDAHTTKNDEGRVFPMTDRLRVLLKAQHDEHLPSVDTSNPAIDRHFKTGHHGGSRDWLLVLLRGHPLTQVGLDLGAPAARPALEDVGMVQQAVEQRGDGRGIAQQLPPVVDGSVRREQGRGPLVAAHDQLQEVFGRGVRQLAHPEVVDDEERDGAQRSEEGLARAVERGLGDLLNERMGFVVEDPIALLDGGAANGLREVTLAGAGRAEQEGILALRDEAHGGQFVDQGAVHLPVEGEIKAVERAVGVPEAGLLMPPGEEAVLAPEKLVGDQRRDEVERGEWLGLGLAEPGLQDIGHAGEPELAERVIDFDEIHGASPVVRSMRSR